MRQSIPVLAFSAICFCCFEAAADDKPIADSLIFFAGFDGGYDAALGESRTLRTAESTKRNNVVDGNHSDVVTLVAGQGRFGDGLRFSGVSKDVVFFDGVNAGYRKENWSGTVSFWLKLDPDKDLAPGFCDPIQMTDKAWNNAALWVDFDKELPRDFRLGVFPAFATWNPDNTPWDDVSPADRPLVTVKRPRFSSDSWTHVAITFENVNGGAADATAALYMNGHSQGRLQRPLTFDWNVDQSAIMIGLSYIGDFDELAVFDAALSAKQIQQLHQLPRGIRQLMKD